MLLLRSLPASPATSTLRRLLQGQACLSSSYHCCRHCLSLPPLFATPPNPSSKDATRTTQGDSIPLTIAMPRRHCPRRTSRWASSTLIITVVIVLDVGATLPPSGNVHGVCCSATAGHGASADANFGRSNSLLRLPFCHPAGAAIPGEEEDNGQVVAAVHPSSWRHCLDKSTSTPLQILLFIFDDVNGCLFLLSSIVVVAWGQRVASVVVIIPPPLHPPPAFHC
jgi:hypothetical protein